MMKLPLLIAFLSVATQVLGQFTIPGIGTIPKIKNPFPTSRPKAVDSVVFQSLYGRWFQAYASQWIIDSQKGGHCVVIDLSEGTVTNDGDDVTMSLDAYWNEKSPQGSAKRSTATMVNNRFNSNPGKFTINIPDGQFMGSIPGVDLSNFEFWIIDTNAGDAGVPMNEQYLVLSDPLGLNVLVLARDPTTFETTRRNSVMNRLKDQGFVLSSNKPKRTFQADAQCTYPPEPGTEPLPAIPDTPPLGATDGDTHQNHTEVPPPVQQQIDAKEAAGSPDTGASSSGANTVGSISGDNDRDNTGSDTADGNTGV